MLHPVFGERQSPLSVPILIHLTASSGESVSLDARHITELRPSFSVLGRKEIYTVLLLEDEAIAVAESPFQIKHLAAAALAALEKTAVVAVVEMPPGWIILTLATGKAIYLKASTITGIALHDHDPGADPAKICVYFGVGNSVSVKESIDDVITLLRSEVRH